MNVSKYFKVYQLSFIHALKNYKALIGLSIFLITCMIIFFHLWKITTARIGSIAYSTQQLLWYTALNQWVHVAIPHIHEEMHEDLKSGRLAYLLPRPISYLGATFADALGKLTVNLIVLGVVTFLFTLYQVGAPPLPTAGMIASLLIGVIAGMIAILYLMIIGLSAFWLNEVDPAYWFWEKLLFLFGGLLLPLMAYPLWMQKLAQFTPFPSLLGGRSALIFDFSYTGVGMLINDLALWGAVALFLLTVVYRKGLRILNIEGG